MIKKKCNICSQKFLEILKLGNHPCADTFLKSKSLSFKTEAISLSCRILQVLAYDLNLYRS